MDFSAAFIGSSYTLASVKAGAQRLVNLYLEINEAEGRRALVYTPGLKLLSTTGIGPNRGMFTASNGRAFAASGGFLYEITDTSSPVSRGAFATSSGTVSMADNGVHLLCVDGSKGYTFKFSDGTFAQIADPDFPVASYVAFQDQYLIVNSVNTGNFYLSGLSDAVDWDALDFAAAEAYPDNLVRLIDHNQQLVLIGSKSIEGWFDSGDVTFPFARIQGSVSGWGTGSPDSFQTIDNNVIGLMRDANGEGMVMRLDNFSPQRVSSFAVELALKDATNINSATSWAYQDRGHTFYCINAPGLSSTWCLDVSSAQWHERQSSGGRHRAENHCLVGSTHVVGDYANGNIYQLDVNTYTDNGAPITRIRRCPRISQELSHITLNEVQIDMETGTIAVGADDPEPTATLSISRDGGSTFGTPRNRGLGTAGDKRKGVIWQRCGEGRDLVFEFSTSMAAPVTIVGAYIRPSAGSW